ncbi:MAG: ParA family protein [Candidatus Sericytochromatia bacterium]|nr:ParA family protein [Candidatus Sericytochromatia bacterium]
MAIKIGIINQKGGVGKTTISNALSYEISHTKNLRTLLIDFDPQASQTILFNLNPREYIKDNQHNIAKIFEKQNILPIKIRENLDFIPANLELSSQSESTVVGKDKMLQKFLNKIEDNYDIILIDSNPSFSSLMTNVVLASDYLVIPIGTSALDEAGAHGFFQIIEDIADIYEKAPAKIYILPTKYDRRRKDDREVLSILQNELSEYLSTLGNLKKSEFYVLPTIPERAVVKDAAASRMFLREYVETYEKTQKGLVLTFEEISKELTKTLINQDVSIKSKKKVKVAGKK